MPSKLGAKVVLDLHEYAPLHWENRTYWMALIAPMIDYTLRQYTTQVALAITVANTIAERYLEEYGLRCEVIRNIPVAQGRNRLQSHRIVDSAHSP